jgi:hypothetical protein
MVDPAIFPRLQIRSLQAYAGLHLGRRLAPQAVMAAGDR